VATSAAVDQIHAGVQAGDGRRLSPSGAPGPLPGDLLGELDDESVRVRDVDGPVSPRSVGRAAEDHCAMGSEPARVGVDVIDEKHDLGGWTGRHRPTGQPLGTASLVESEPGALGAELRVSGVGEPVRQAEHITVERDGHVEVGDIQDDVSDAIHALTLRGAGQKTLITLAP
jgi:hypothetical protein